MKEIKVVDAFNVTSHDGKFGKFQTKDGETRFLSFGRDIVVEKIFRNSDDGAYHLLLSFEKNEADRQELLVARKQIAQPDFYEILSGLGADIVKGNADLLQAHLMKQFAELKSTHFLHEKLGWRTGSQDLEFRSWHSTGKKSRYIGRWDVESAGSFKIWRKMVREDVLPHSNLTVALLLGLSAPISALLSEHFHLQNPIYSISGNSSRGKTTAGILAASTTFNPREGTYSGKNFLGQQCEKTGGILSWHLTSNQLITSLLHFSGVVSVIDEISKFRESDMSNIVYSLSDGIEKGRLSKNLTVSATPCFRTAVISIGEERLTDRCRSDRDGVRVRILEIDGDMTIDAEHSSRIVSCCRDNYGHAVPKLAKWIVKNGGGETVIGTYLRWKRAFAKVAPENHYAPRRIELFVAPLMTTAELCKTALKLDFDLEALQRYFSEVLQRESDSIDLPTRAYHAFASYIAEYRANFDGNHTSARQFGRIYEGQEIRQGKRPALPDGLIREVAVRFREFDKFLQSHGFGNKSLILRSWKARGLLSCETGKLYHRRKIDGITEQMYVVRFFSEDHEDEAQTSSSKRKPVVLSEADLDDM